MKRSTIAYFDLDGVGGCLRSAEIGIELITGGGGSQSRAGHANSGSIHCKNIESALYAYRAIQVFEQGNVSDASMTKDAVIVYITEQFQVVIEPSPSDTGTVNLVGLIIVGKPV